MPIFKFNSFFTFHYLEESGHGHIPHNIHMPDASQCLAVTAAENGLQAWKLLEDMTNHVDLVLTEVVMPYLSGIDLLCKIMNHKTCKTIPVISEYPSCTTTKLFLLWLCYFFLLILLTATPGEICLQ